MTQTLWIQRVPVKKSINDFLSLHKWKWQAPVITVNICLLSANRPSVVPEFTYGCKIGFAHVPATALSQCTTSPMEPATIIERTQW